MIKGAITGHDVVRHPWTIFRAYGLRTLVRALVWAIDGKEHTWLECVTNAKKGEGK